MPPIPVQCVQCQELFRSQLSFEETHKPETGHTSTYVCLECLETFASNKARREHMTESKHKTPLGIWSALAASRGLDTSATVDYESTSSQEEDTAGASDRQPDTEEVSFCPVCETPFQNKNALAAHISSTLVCTTCKVCLDPSQTLQDHFWDVPVHPKCRPCALGFADQAAYLDHKADCPVAPSRAAAKRPALGAGRSSLKLPDPASAPDEQPVKPARTDDGRAASATDPSLISDPSFLQTTSEEPVSQDSTDIPSDGEEEVDDVTRSESEDFEEPDGPVVAPHLRSNITPTTDSFPRRTFSVASSATAPRPSNIHSSVSMPSSRTLFWHCRSCTREPCVDPIATICGHIFCQKCFLRELKSGMCCPVCKKAYLIRLHVELDA